MSIEVGGHKRNPRKTASCGDSSSLLALHRVTVLEKPTPSADHLVRVQDPDLSLSFVSKHGRVNVRRREVRFQLAATPPFVISLLVSCLTQIPLGFQIESASCSIACLPSKRLTTTACTLVLVWDQVADLCGAGDGHTVSLLSSHKDLFALGETLCTR
jgi:hypothetical protein